MWMCTAQISNDVINSSAPGPVAGTEGVLGNAVLSDAGPAWTGADTRGYQTQADGSDKQKHPPERRLPKMKVL